MCLSKSYNPKVLWVAPMLDCFYTARMAIAPPADLSLAQRLARECLARNYKNCGR